MEQLLIQGTTLQALSERYIHQHLTVYRTGDLKPDLSRLRNLLKGLPQSLTEGAVVTFFANLKGTPSTRNRYRALLRHMLKWGREVGYNITMPIVALKLEQETNQRGIRLRVQEEMLLVENMPTALYELFIMACYTGLRRGALCQLTSKHIDLTKRLITVPAEMQKQKRLQKIPMADPVYKLLHKLLAASPSEKDKLFTWSRHEWDKVRKGAGLRHLRWHDLRHEFGSRLLDQKVALPTIQRLLGHSQITTTMRYLNATDVEDEDRAAIARLA